MRRTGFTLVELLVVISIIGLLIGLLLPAVQAARGSARLLQCKHHLRQIGLALHGYAELHQGYLPARARYIKADKSSGLSWRATLLPFLEQQALHDALDMKKGPLETPNRRVMATQLSLFQCPVAPDSPQTFLDYVSTLQSKVPGAACAATDYVTVALAENQFVTSGTFNTLWTPPGFEARSDAISNPALMGSASLTECQDGLSNTVLLFEQVNRQRHVHADGSWNTSGYPAAWLPLDECRLFWTKVNYCTQNGLFSYHPDGEILLMGDNSVRPISAGIAAAPLAAMFTRDGSEAATVPGG